MRQNDLQWNPGCIIRSRVATGIPFLGSLPSNAREKRQNKRATIQDEAFNNESDSDRRVENEFNIGY